ncbi:MAG: glycosyltransferase family 39 protein [Acidobacteriota bacterium]|nr:glycosyltransferase family 39 protein [Acidobacteriota bacterium]
MAQMWRVILFSIGVIYLTLFNQLGNLAFVGPDEPRYARIGEEMHISGNYVTPTLHHLPWLEKPPLLFWLEAGSFSLFGTHEWSARLPAAALALISTVIIGAFVIYLKGLQTGILTILILCTSGLFFVFSRAASTDTILVSMLSIAMVCGYRTAYNTSNLWGACAGIALGLAVLAKGPVAIVLFAGVFGLYFLLTQRLRWNTLQILLLTSSFSLTAGPWFWQVFRENGYNFVATFWINHHLARFFTDLHHHSQPFWYYGPVLLIGFFPWVFFLGSALLRSWRYRKHILDPRFHPELFLWLWAVVPLVFFSISESKLAGYILPVLPPLSILVALEWNDWIEGNVANQRFMRIQLFVLGGFALLFSAALIWGFYSIYYAPVVGVLLAMPIIAGVVMALLKWQFQRPTTAFLSLVTAMTLFASLAYWKAAPVVDDYHSAKDLSKLILAKISEREPLILYRYFHHTALYYTNYQITPEAFNSVDALNNYFGKHPQNNYYILTQKAGQKDLEHLQAKLVKHQGNLYLFEVATHY